MVKEGRQAGRWCAPVPPSWRKLTGQPPSPSEAGKRRSAYVDTDCMVTGLRKNEMGWRHEWMGWCVHIGRQRLD